MTFEYTTNGGASWTTATVTGSSNVYAFPNAGFSATFANASSVYTAGATYYWYANTGLITWGNDDSTALANACASIGSGTLRLSRGNYYIGPGSRSACPQAFSSSSSKGQSWSALSRASATQAIFAGTGFKGNYSHSESGPHVVLSVLYGAVPNQAFGFGPFGVTSLNVTFTTGGSIGAAAFTYSLNGGPAVGPIATVNPAGSSLGATYPPFVFVIPGTGLSR